MEGYAFLYRRHGHVAGEANGHIARVRTFLALACIALALASCGGNATKMGPVGDPSQLFTFNAAGSAVFGTVSKEKRCLEGGNAYTALWCGSLRQPRS